MKTLAVLILGVGISFAAAGYPRHAFLDLPTAVPLGDTGRTYFQTRFVDEKPGFTIARSLGPGIDIFAVTTLETPFSLGIHALIVQDLGPLSVAVDAESDGIRVSGGLLLGPIRIDWGRTLSVEGKPWGTLSASLTQHFTLVIGVERIGKTLLFLGGARLHPFTGTWAVSLLLREGRVFFAVGGFF